MHYVSHKADQYPYLNLRGVRTRRRLVTLTFGLFTVDFEKEHCPLRGWLFYFGFGCLTYCRTLCD